MKAIKYALTYIWGVLTVIFILMWQSKDVLIFATGVTFSVVTFIILLSVVGIYLVSNWNKE